MTVPKAWSYSALSTYLGICTLKYAFKYVWGFEPERSFSRMHFGLAVHAGLEAAYRVWKPAGSVPLDLAKETFVEDLRIRLEDPLILFKKGETREGLLDEGEGLLEAWAAQAQHEEVLTTESEFTVPIVNPRTGEIHERELKGWFDLVVKDPDTGDPMVVDFKTTARRFSLTHLDDDLQARIYGYALRQIHGLERAGLRWEVLIRTKKPGVQKLEAIKGPEDDARLFELIQAVEKGVAAGVFFPNEGSMWCGGCPHSDACSRWAENPEVLRTSSADAYSRRAS